MNKHTLFTLKPGFYDGEKGPYFCPHSAVIEGMLKYIPELENKVDVQRVDFVRPRNEVISLLGEENQGNPVLVLAEGAIIPSNAKISDETGRAFIDDEIANFLADEFGVMRPH